jgi:hypothetical protein
VTGRCAFGIMPSGADPLSTRRLLPMTPHSASSA